MSEARKQWYLRGILNQVQQNCAKSMGPLSLCLVLNSPKQRAGRCSCGLLREECTADESLMPQTALLILTTTNPMCALLRLLEFCVQVWAALTCGSSLQAAASQVNVMCAVFDAFPGNELGMVPETTARSQEGWEGMCLFIYESQAVRPF